MNEQIVDLDVRPYLRKKLEPFKVIMETVSALKPEDIFILHATFKPTPLFGVLKVKGYSHKEEEIETGYWIVAFAREEQTLNRLELSKYKRQDDEEEGLRDDT